MEPDTPHVNGHGVNAIPGAPVQPCRQTFLSTRERDSSRSEVQPQLPSYMSSGGSKQSHGDIDKDLTASSIQDSHSDIQPSIFAHGHDTSSTLGFGLHDNQHGQAAQTGTAHVGVVGTKEPNRSADRKRRAHVPKESPLKRPFKQGAAPPPVEKPLRRPHNAIEEIVYSETIATFAVDVPGSTEGKILEEEKETIRTLCSGLSRDAFTQAEIIPWAHDVQPGVRADEIETLYSFGGTEPSRLNSSSVSKMALSRSSAWFLLTDGEIDRSETESFSQGICDAGLHGKPCIVILFGYMTLRPSWCNISVGLSVFSNAANCLFLFHDIDTTKVYIFQSKGVFNAMLPPGQHHVILTPATLWGDLPLFKYRQLFDLPLPAPQVLRADDLLLQGGGKINLQDLYQNRIDPSTADQILSSNDNLQSVLLAAQLRGDDDDIRRWVSNQKVGGKDVLLCERPDVGRKAADTMRELMAIQPLCDPKGRRSDLQQALRKAHRMNWVKFATSISADHEKRSTRNTVVKDFIERIGSNRGEMDRGTSSPSMLSPISAQTGGQSCQAYSSMTPGLGIMNGNKANYGFTAPFGPQDFDQYPPGAPRQAHERLPYPGGPRERAWNCLSISRIKDMLAGDNAGVLYVQHYKYDTMGSRSDGLEDTCPICREENALLVFLLKEPPTDVQTPIFPGPGQRKALAYPLAMGAYPETDILAPVICCDACAYTLIKGKIDCNNDNITAAIPIARSAFIGNYRSKTLKNLDVAFQRRFQEPFNELVFLSVLYNTLTNLDNAVSELLLEALKTACLWMVGVMQLPQGLSMSLAGSTPESSIFGDPMPMAQVLRKNLKDIEMHEAPLLRYPLGGFTVLMRIVTDLRLVPSHDICMLAVWQRFLFHLIERHCAFLATDQQGAILALNEILQIQVADGGLKIEDKGTLSEKGSTQAVPVDESADISMESPVSKQFQTLPSQLDVIVGTHLLSEEDLEEFQCLDNLFVPVMQSCGSCLGRFLPCLSQQVTTSFPPIDIFDDMRGREDLSDIFQLPRNP